MIVNKLVLAVAVFVVADVAHASQEGALSLSKFRLESEGIGESGKILVEGRVNDKQQVVELKVHAFAKDYVVPPKKLESLADLQPNGIRISYERGYEELGGRTVYVQMQLGFTCYTVQTALVTITEKGDIDVAVSKRRNEPSPEASDSTENGRTARPESHQAAVTVDLTKGKINVCEVHRVPMTKREVPFAHGMIPMSREKEESQQGEWKRRTTLYPHPGDCEPATDIVMPGQEGRALVFVCPECERALQQKQKTKPGRQGTSDQPNPGR